MTEAIGGWRSKLRCPACTRPLPYTSLHCACGQRYGRTASGAPILLALDSPFYGKAGNQVLDEPASWMRRLVPSLTLNRAAAQNLGALADELLRERESSTVLLVGGGESGVGIADLRRTGIHLVSTDVVCRSTTAVVADGHNLPWEDHAFDAVVIQAVLEHVLDPEQMVSECRRVTSPGGFLYAETPFMQPVHAAAYDFRRYTAVGHRWLFREYKEIKSGQVAGPGTALAWSLAYAFAALARTPKQRRILMGIGRMLFFWVRYWDLAVQDRPASHDAASAHYFFGRKDDVNLTFDELISVYPGAM